MPDHFLGQTRSSLHRGLSIVRDMKPATDTRAFPLNSVVLQQYLLHHAAVAHSDTRYGACAGLHSRHAGLFEQTDNFGYTNSAIVLGIQDPYS